MQLTNTKLKVAIQKSGRLTEDTVDFLRSAGLEFDSYGKKQLFSICRNFPLELLFVRDDDIIDYVNSGSIDLGIVGQNMLYEKPSGVKKLLNLRYSFCKLVIGIPRDSSINTLQDLEGKKIATSYPYSTKQYFRKQGISVDIIKINGSLEITPTLGIADAIVDLMSSGSTMKMNDLQLLEVIFESEAVFIANKDMMADEKQKKIIDSLLMRFKSVLSAKNNKYVMMNAPETSLPRLKKLAPGLQSPTIAPLAQAGWVSVQAVINEEIFWDTVERLKKIGATGIIVLPIEKMIS